jgi:hypothetical protein
MGRVPGGDAVGFLGKGPVVFMRDIFGLNEIWTNDKMHVLVGNLLG